MPVLGSTKGFAVGCGILPDYGDLDPYAMAACAIDEAVRNVVAVGADPSRIAILDNFCWGNTDRPEVLGSLVMAAEACKDFAITFEMPFISGKDSLKNEFHAKGKSIVIPPTLLISAIGIVQDVRQCITMDMKKAGNKLFLVGRLTENIGGSQYAKALQLIGGIVPRPNAKEAIAIHKAMHSAITAATVRSCHDVSEGGLAVTIAEMAFAGGIGADIHGLNSLGNIPFAAMLFAEPPTCYVVEVEPQKVEQFQAIFKGLPVHEIGTACVEKRLRFVGPTGEWALWTSLEDLRKAWLSTLKF
jgi:phosphoribosylformylglycinamidine synthase